MKWLRGRILLGSVAFLATTVVSRAQALSAAPDAGVQVAQFLRLGEPSERPAAAASEDLEPLEGVGENVRPAAPRASNRGRRSNGEGPATDGASADQTQSTPAKKPAPAVAQRLVFPKTGPLPPQRPWGDRDAFTDADVAVSAPEVQPARAPIPVAALPAPAVPAPRNASAPLAPAALAPAPVKPASGPAPDHAVVILVRNDVTRPEDLQGRKVALGPTSATADDLRGVVQANAGVTVDAVQLNWTSGLQGLARGEIDGVLLSVGPKMSAEEVTSLALGSYKLLEIPIQKLAN